MDVTLHTWIAIAMNSTHAFALGRAIGYDYLNLPWTMESGGDG